MRILFGFAACCVFASTALAAEPTEYKKVEQECVDVTQIPAGRGLERQLQCVVTYHGQIHILRARMCTLPDGTWVLNAYWDCNTNK